MPSGLKVESMEREEARMQAMRMRNEARRQRCMNARQRTIGVDVAALEAQVKEKADMKAQEKADGSEGLAQMEYINALIEQREMEERALKKKEMEALKAVWAEQQTYPKNQPSKKTDPWVPEECGLSALQSFAGEDTSSASRMRLQQQQMRSWSAQQHAEKEAKEAEEKEEMRRYAAYMNMVADSRAELEAEEAKQVKEACKMLKDNNLSLAADQASLKASMRSEEAAADKEEIEFMLQHPLLCENTEDMVGEDGHLRRDRFKGYSKDQILQIFKDNEAMVAAKDTSAEKLEDVAWKSHQHQLHDLLDAASAQEQANTRSANMQHRALLEVQRKEQQERARQMKMDRFGAVDNGYFEGFGTSYR